MQIHQVEHHTIGKIAKATVINNNTLASINHLMSPAINPHDYWGLGDAYLDVIKLGFFHSLEMGNLGPHPTDVVLNRIILVPALVLCQLVSRFPQERR